MMNVHDRCRDPRSRRAIAWTIVALAGLFTWWCGERIEDRLGQRGWFTGYALLALCLCMLLLSLRKRLLVLPLGRVAYWLQFHQYIGAFAMLVFIMHAGWTFHGVLETTLAIAFLLISFSGIVLAYLNRTCPRKLAAAGASPLIHDIPFLRRRIAQQAFRLALASAGKLESACLSEHYTRELVRFFQRPRTLAYCLIPTGRHRRRILGNLDRLDRYLDPPGRQQRDQMCQLVRAKDDLDFQWAMQQRLRWWQVVHVSLIWFFMVLMFLHALLVHRFHGN
jgi:hypothetical protein